MALSPRHKLAAGRLIAKEQAPWFRAALHALIPREMPGLDTMGVSEQAVLFWDPEAIKRWKPEQIAGVLIHEIGHLLRDHAARRRALAAEPELWNAAGDLEINDDLGRYKLPEEGLHPEKEGLKVGQLAEAYYAQLRQRQQEQGGKEGQEGQEGKRVPGEGKGGKPRVARGWCGSGAGRPMPQEPKAKEGSQGKPEPSQGGALEAPGRSQRELERVRKAVARDIQAEASRSRGTVPGGWVAWAGKELEPPRISWQAKLAVLARSAVAFASGLVDYHYSRPARRQAGIGWGHGRPILPALRRPIVRVAVVVDTSGSMGQQQLGAALAETSGIMRAIGAEVTFVACDASVHAIKEVRSWRDLLPLMLGGGGTDFTPAFEALERSRKRPDVIVFFTDGYGSAPESAPARTKTIWVLVDSTHRPCTWGDFIEIDTKQKQQ